MLVGGASQALVFSLPQCVIPRDVTGPAMGECLSMPSRSDLRFDFLSVFVTNSSTPLVSAANQLKQF